MEKSIVKKSFAEKSIVEKSIVKKSIVEESVIEIYHRVENLPSRNPSLRNILSRNQSLEI